MVLTGKMYACCVISSLVHIHRVSHVLQDTKRRYREECIKQQNGNKLPRPEFGIAGATSVKNSVFSNPFVEAENAKKAILEKHVKMTPTKDEVKMINGKKICWNFRKGRCRFGHNCKFAHDSDLQRENSDLVPLPDQTVTDVETELENDNTKVVRKKRPGLTQGLVPGKKVMKMYKKQITASR